MGRLVITLATRDRAEKLVDTIERSIINWTDPDTVLVVQADEDDPKTYEAVQRGQIIKWGQRVLIDVAPRPDTIAEKWNRAVKQPDAELFLVAADDDPYITPGYDSRLLEAGRRFDDGIGMVYGHMANASFSGAVCPTAKFVEKMGGKIFPEFFPYWFVDHWTDDLCRIIGRISFADIRTDQSNVGKTQELREVGWWATFFDCAYLERRRIAQSIIQDFEFKGTEGQKQILMTHHPLIEYRSKWINDNVRQQERAGAFRSWNLSLDDPRYQRVKQRAIATVPKFLAGMDPVEAMQWQYALNPPTLIPNIKPAYSK